MVSPSETVKYLYVPATGLSENAQYRLKLDMAQNTQEETEVKVLNELVYNGNNVGIFNPEHPDGTTEEAALHLGRKLLRSGKYGTDGKTVRDVLVVREVESPAGIQSMTDAVEADIEALTYRILVKSNSALSPVVSLEHMETIHMEETDPLLYGFIFRVKIS